jgi:pantothenate kinase
MMVTKTINQHLATITRVKNVISVRREAITVDIVPQDGHHVSLSIVKKLFVLL